jgi:hypothetical protein
MKAKIEPYDSAPGSALAQNSRAPSTSEVGQQAGQFGRARVLVDVGLGQAQDHRASTKADRIDSATKAARQPNVTCR